ncbi:hypothetical protein M2401_001216 [Pseudomonas sp. JUb42]|uniref:hypothetical protein n=1 Tax=Pseudomonas sp. JUb42 TaxID=2940611 RepID=UPI002167BAC5|nr:hypothetical protein [Pseudomonas sp. JUb42]MCS3467495.1 hypothetical protein [Pseudomonas sp. JUb42]
MRYRERSDEHAERFQQAIANHLGITAEELDEWVVLEQEEFTDEGELVSHFLEFDKNTPSGILARVGLPQDGTKVKYLEPGSITLLDDDVPSLGSAEGAEPLTQVSAATYQPSSFPKVVKWLFISLLVAVSAAAATVAWILHSLGPMPSFG